MTDAKKLIAALNAAAQKSMTGSCIPFDDGRAAVRAVLAELDRQGWAVVPKVPTEAMTRTAFTLFHGERSVAGESRKACLLRGMGHAIAGAVATYPKLLEDK